jgi:hypothetical protein
MNTEIRDWPHFAMEMLSILLLVCCFIPLLKLNQLNGAEVPIHVDATGAVDRTGKASDLIAMPLMALFMFVVLTVAEKFPKLINAPKKLSENGKEYVAANGWKVMRELKLCAMGLMLYLTYWSFALAYGKAEEMPLWGFCLFIGAMLIVMIRFYYRLYNYN